MKAMAFCELLIVSAGEVTFVGVPTAAVPDKVSFVRILPVILALNVSDIAYAVSICATHPMLVDNKMIIIRFLIFVFAFYFSEITIKIVPLLCKS